MLGSSTERSHQNAVHLCSGMHRLSTANMATVLAAASAPETAPIADIGAELVQFPGLNAPIPDGAAPESWLPGMGPGSMQYATPAGHKRPPEPGVHQGMMRKMQRLEGFGVLSSGAMV